MIYHIESRNLARNYAMNPWISSRKAEEVFRDGQHRTCHLVAIVNQYLLLIETIMKSI